ncbi:hypothetical protein GJ744_000118 [Endocarpon pusillum]|uniref:Uncharacterized protein n=1 Tax=Endocarpon pusillum TaxID=364733 RepID=A0A8H7EAJ9_9EURO|nr:hypothetical protein GJ744_000118 [Endocarpon pusillum]
MGPGSSLTWTGGDIFLFLPTELRGPVKLFSRRHTGVFALPMSPIQHSGFLMVLSCSRWQSLLDQRDVDEIDGHLHETFTRRSLAILDDGLHRLNVGE